MRWQDLIETNPDVMVGKPVFKGTRLKVETVLRELGQGVSTADLVKQYPTMKPEFARAAMLYAADRLEQLVDVAA
ncbi:MAG: DUF433 domain-containing protein [Planctomycetota bacterium]